MHGIEKPYDLLFSTVSPEWHGIANVVPFIDSTVAAPLLFPIREGRITIDIEGRAVEMGNHKALVADLRGRSDLAPDDQFKGLHIPKNSYTIIDNRALWEAAEKAIKGIGAKVTCIGTLRGCKTFFISIQLAEDGGQFKVNNDVYSANLNLVTSHDGTMAAQVFDSTVRIVCMNTLRWSLQSKGALNFMAYHTSGASLAMERLGDLANDALAGRAVFRSNMEYLASVPCDADTAELLALGFFVTQTGEVKQSKRCQNAAAEISLLFSRGDGNLGRSLYDALNGFTQYYTSGSGTGKKGSREDKAFKANFGAAADHKSMFANMLLSPDTVARLTEKGREARMELARLV
jgi:hypothetical protein